MIEENKEEAVQKTDEILILDVPETKDTEPTTSATPEVKENPVTPVAEPASQPVNPESTSSVPASPTTTEQTTQEAKEEPKQAKKKFAFLSMSLTKEKDPNKPKKKMDKMILRCWIIIAISSTFIILPVLFRKLFALPEEIKPPTTVIKTTVRCLKTETMEGFMLARNLEAVYEGPDFVELGLSYSTLKTGQDAPPAIGDVELDELTEFKNMKDPNVKSSTTDGVLKYTFDYRNGNFSKVEALNIHGKLASVAVQYYKNTGYRCEVSSEEIDISKK
jgi:hypothetical protein